MKYAKRFLRDYIRPILLVVCPKLYVSFLLAAKKKGFHFKPLVQEACNNIKFLKVYKSKKINYYRKLLRNVEIGVEDNEYFFYSIDVNTYVIPNGFLVDNGTVDYSLFLENSLNDLARDNEDRRIVVEAIAEYIVRLQSIRCNPDIKRNIENLRKMGECKAESVEEALQRILFINQLIWQTGHRLNGLGRLDLVLEPYIKDELSDEYLLDLFKKFCVAVHKYFYYKSNQLSGDTGQLIILGGCDKYGNAVHNRVTDLMLKAVKEIKLPDPKILLRVSEHTDDELWTNAIECLCAQTGSPLFSNDEVILQKLIAFGYDKEDSFDYTTSACWEPVVGNCMEQNNVWVLNFLKPFEVISVKIDKYIDIDEMYQEYFKLLDRQIKEICNVLGKTYYSYDPFLSMGIRYCVENNVDISVGGGKYHNIGILSVGLANTVNSFLNIAKAFNDNRIAELKGNIESDFEKKENQSLFFGKSDETVINITNKIVDHCGVELLKYRNYYGGIIKFGLSAPDYISIGKKMGATPDGRRKGEPLHVHISSDVGVAPTELIEFASAIDYPENGFNGNVIDFFMNSSFVDEHKNAFVQLMKGAVKKGFFQMQMNLLSSKTLIEARKSPEQFPNLIVRVWGFSAYFNDLPDEYKDFLIERAIASESAC